MLINKFSKGTGYINENTDTAARCGSSRGTGQMLSLNTQWGRRKYCRAIVWETPALQLFASLPAVNPLLCLYTFVLLWIDSSCETLRMV